MKKIIPLVVVIFAYAACKKEQNLTYPMQIAAGEKSGQGITWYDIQPDTSLYFTYPSSGSVYRLDMDDDGADDFEFTFLGSASPGHQLFANKLIPLHGNMIAVTNRADAWADTLIAGAAISNNLIWSSDTCILCTSSWYGGSGNADGIWHDVKGNYAGVKLVSGGHERYGWVRLDMNGTTKMTIMEYGHTEGYE